MQQVSQLVTPQEELTNPMDNPVRSVRPQLVSLMDFLKENKITLQDASTMLLVYLCYSEYLYGGKEQVKKFISSFMADAIDSLYLTVDANEIVPPNTTIN